MNARLGPSLYNQDGADDDDFIARFVARHDALAVLLRRLRAIDPAGDGLHHILIGPRGMGKTSLLRRLAIAIGREPDLAARYIPLRFREEQYNVLTLADFWRNCGEALAEWAEAAGRDDLASRLDRDLPTRAWADDAASFERFDAEMVALDRRAVLLVDNVDLIIDALPKGSDWVLRRHLQAGRGPIMIGAATQQLRQSADRDAAFYEFFQPMLLEPLDERETEECMRALASARGEHGQGVVQVLDRQPERLRTLHTLTGGNPRVLALIYRLLESGESEAAMADLDILLDQVTPYYKARIEEYQTPQQRAVIDAISLNWDPVTAADLSRATNIAATSLPALLSRFRRDGLIETVERSGASAGHQLVERFFNIWYLMRHGTRRTKRRMRWLVAFLTSFYSSNELAEIARRAELKGASKNWPADYASAFQEAIKHRDPGYLGRARGSGSVDPAAGSQEEVSGSGDNPPGPRLFRISALERQARELWEAGDYAACDVVLDDIISAITDADRPALSNVHAGMLFNKALLFDRAGDPASEIAVYDQLVTMFSHLENAASNELVSRALFNKAVTFGQVGDSAAEIAAYDELLTRFTAPEELGIRERVARTLINKAITLRQMDDAQAAIEVYDDMLSRFRDANEISLQEQVAMALFNKGVALKQTGDNKAEIAAYDELLLRFGKPGSAMLRRQVANALFNKAITSEESEDNRAAVSSYDAIYSRFHDADDTVLRERVAAALVNKGVVLGRLGDERGEISSYDSLLARFSDATEPALREQLAKALINKGITLGQLGDSAAEIAAYDDLLARFADAEEAEIRDEITKALMLRAVTLDQMGDDRAAISAYERAMSRPTSASDMSLRHFYAAARIRFANLLFDLEGEHDRAEALYLEAAAEDALLARSNLTWLYLTTDRLSDASGIRNTLDDLPTPGLPLMDAATELSRDNFGLAIGHLDAAFADGELDAGEMDFSIDLLRLLRHGERKGYGERLLAWFEESGSAERLAPVYAAFKAYVGSEKVLLDFNPEIRGPARIIYDRLDAPRRYRREVVPPRGEARRRRGRPRKAGREGTDRARADPAG